MSAGAALGGDVARAIDVSRLMHYTFFTPSGLTIHARGLPTLIHFIETRANLFRAMAAREARSIFRLADFRGQAPDHPVLLAMRETDYLKCAVLEKMG